MRSFLLAVVGASVLAAAPPARATEFTVVIDPGHGGSNTGAPGAVEGLFEKRVTLAVARAVKRQLEASGVRVVLTRARDQYLTLRERGRRARLAKADCFLSLHANASPDHRRRGIETFVLAADATEVEARRDAAAAPDAAQGLVAELVRLEHGRAALELAQAVQQRLVKTARRRGDDVDRGVRQAPYDVLTAPGAPAILVEMGFIDHPIDGPELAEPAAQQRIARAIAEGVLAFRSRAAPAFAQRL